MLTFELLGLASIAAYLPAELSEKIERFTIKGPGKACFIAPPV